MTNPLIIIPARMGSSRFPGKPLADIHGKPMIIHVLDRAAEADCGDIYAACAEEDIAIEVRRYGYKAILTDPSLSSGTDRVKAVADIVDPEKRHNIVINVQGDTPTSRYYAFLLNSHAGIVLSFTHSVDPA